MFEKIIPIKLYLHILQLNGYKWDRMLRWVMANPFKRTIENKIPLGWSPKAKVLYIISWVWGTIFLFLFWPFGVIAFFQPWILLILALIVLKPYEAIRIRYTYWQSRQKINYLKNKGLRVIGITGSYGKTSTKEFLYQILKTKYRVLRTPESYNTVFGIAKVIEWELDENYDFFICELGAYRVGEITELCKMVDPDHAILTGINEQHLERFKNIKNTIKAKFELVDYVLNKKGKIVANLGNELVRKHAKDVTGYGLGSYSHPSEQNIEGAFMLAKLFGIKKLPKMELPTHRLKLINRGEMKIIDDAYSGNVNGFRAAVKYLKSFKGWKVIVTPGIPELGAATYAIHKKLGKELIDLDQVILVGKNERTRGLADGFGKPVIYIEKVTDAIGKVVNSKAVILFENDLPDNY